MDHDNRDGTGDSATNSLFMMAMMMACCVAVLLLFALIPIVGWPIGVPLGLGGIAAMLLAHQRWMRHGHH